MEPAQTILAKLGGPTAVSKVLGIHRTRASNWQRPRIKGGTDGVVPQRYHRQLLDHATSIGVELSPADFLPARAPAEESAA